MEARAAVVTALVCAHRVQTVRYTFRGIPSQVEALLLPDLADHDPRRGIRDRGRRNAPPCASKTPDGSEAGSLRRTGMPGPNRFGSGPNSPSPLMRKKSDEKECQRDASQNIQTS